MTMTKEELLKKYEKEIDEFQEWIDTQPRLPKNIDRLLLLRHLKVYDFDLEKAKALLILNLETRKKNPHIFHKREISSKEFQQAMNTMQCFGLPKNTKENHKITIFRLMDPDARNFSYVDMVRMIMALMDARLVHCDENELIDGEVGVIDVSGFGFRHFTHVLANISTMKAYSRYAQEAAPIKIIQNHFINCSSIMEKLLAVMKPFLNKEVIESIKVHTSHETLHEYIPKELLPVEYGGTEFSLDDLKMTAKAFIEQEEMTKYVENDDNWKIED